MTIIDLSNCNREPIHIPGKIQAHGFLIAICQELKITYCSENIAAFTSVTAVILLGKPVYYLETVILKKVAGFIEKLLQIGWPGIPLKSVTLPGGLNTFNFM